MEYEKCLVQLDEVLKHLIYEDSRKIPDEIIKAIKDKKDNLYSWKYDESKDLNEQNLDRKTIAMLSYLNMEYLLDKEQKSLMDKIHKFNEEKLEEEKNKKYNPDNIFKKASTSNTKEKMELAKVSTKKWYEKIYLFFKKENGKNNDKIKNSR